MSKISTAHSTIVRVTVLNETPHLELRDPSNPAIVKRVAGPVSIWGTMQMIRGNRWFIPTGWGGYGIFYNTSRRSLLHAWDESVIDAYEVDPADGKMRKLFNV